MTQTVFTLSLALLTIIPVYVASCSDSGETAVFTEVSSMPSVLPASDEGVRRTAVLNFAGINTLSAETTCTQPKMITFFADDLFTGDFHSENLTCTDVINSQKGKGIQCLLSLDAEAGDWYYLSAVVWVPVGCEEVEVTAVTCGGRGAVYEFACG